MAYYYGHTHDELSTMMRVPLGTVKAWIRRGMEKLRECHG
jgi:RNA polymerase sigma-70 factor, ECF subfamily